MSKRTADLRIERIETAHDAVIAIAKAWEGEHSKLPFSISWSSEGICEVDVQLTEAVRALRELEAENG